MKRTIFMSALLFACSSENPAVDAGEDAAPDVADSGPADAPPETTTTTTCSGFTTDAAAIQQMFVATDTPVGDGGVLVDGVYDVTAWSVYTGVDGGTGSTGMTVQATQVIQGGTYKYNEQFTVADGGGTFDTSGTMKVFDGGAAVGAQLCPNGPVPFTSYSTDGTNLIWYATNPPWGLAMKRR